jgi:hypothetical protein
MSRVTERLGKPTAASRSKAKSKEQSDGENRSRTVRPAPLLGQTRKEIEPKSDDDLMKSVPDDSNVGDIAEAPLPQSRRGSPGHSPDSATREEEPPASEDHSRIYQKIALNPLSVFGQSAQIVT